MELMASRLKGLIRRRILKGLRSRGSRKVTVLMREIAMGVERGAVPLSPG